MSSTPEPRPSEAPLMTPAVKGVGGGGERLGGAGKPSETNNRAPDTLKEKTRFHEKKKG